MSSTRYFWHRSKSIPRLTRRTSPKTLEKSARPALRDKLCDFSILLLRGLFSFTPLICAYLYLWVFKAHSQYVWINQSTSQCKNYSWRPGPFRGELYGITDNRKKCLNRKSVKMLWVLWRLDVLVLLQQWQKNKEKKIIAKMQ